MKKSNPTSNLTVLLFPDGTRVRLSELETYQPDGAKESPNGVSLRLRSGRTLLWSAAGTNSEQRARHTADILSGLDEIFGRRDLAHDE